MQKRFFIILLLSLFVGTAVFAQGDHLRFEGLSLSGDYNSFARQLRKKHFRFKTKDHQEPFMEGKVLGEKADVTILVTPKSYQVYMILASYPQRESWALLKNQYESMKMKLFARYGDPQHSLETFASAAAEADPLEGLSTGYTSYVSTWVVPGGEIIMSLSEDARVQIYFMDKEGMARANAEQ